MTGSKGKASALARLKKAGKAWVYENKTWKFILTVVLCGEDEMSMVVRESMASGSDRIVTKGMSGLSMDSEIAPASRGGSRYMMWVNTEKGLSALGALAHESVHIAGMALSDCGVPCDIKDMGKSECVAYLVEDIVNFSVDKMSTMGLVR